MLSNCVSYPLSCAASLLFIFSLPFTYQVYPISLPLIPYFKFFKFILFPLFRLSSFPTPCSICFFPSIHCFLLSIYPYFFSFPSFIHSLSFYSPLCSLFSPFLCLLPFTSSFFSFLLYQTIK